MLKCSLNLLNVISTLPYVNLWVLRILNTKPKATSLIPSFPVSFAFLEIITFLPNRNCNIFIVKNSSIKFKEINQMFAKINLISTAIFIASLKVTSNKHREQERSNSPGIGFIELPTFKE